MYLLQNGTAQPSGSPFGSGPVTLSESVLRLNGQGTPTTTTVGDLTVTAASGTWVGASSLLVDASLGGATTFAAGNLVRGGAGGMPPNGCCRRLCAAGCATPR